MDETEVVSQTAMFLGVKLFKILEIVGLVSAALGLLCCIVSGDKTPDQDEQKPENNIK